MSMKTPRTNVYKVAASVVAAMGGALLLISCATTEVTELWRDQSYQKQPTKVLVQAMLRKPANRRLLEDEFVGHFRYRGVEAVPAYTLFPGDELATQEALKEQLRTGGFDALLLMRLVGEKKEERIVPGTITRHPAPYSMAPHYGGWPGYYGGSYTTVYSPSYRVEDKFAIAETSLYDVGTEKLIWTATSETWLSDPAKKLIKTYVTLMMDSLRKQKLVP